MGSQIAFALGGGLAAVGTGVFIGGLVTKPSKREVSFNVGLGSAWLSGSF